MYTGFQPTAYFTQAQITAGEANNLPGIRIIVVDVHGAATGVVMEGGPAAPATTQTSGNSPRNNFAATTDPTVGDDSADGYSIGSRWINTATSESFICFNAIVGAAVWELSTADIIADIAGLQAALNSKQDAATAATDAELSTHTGNGSNPHVVTKAQVGLGNADNTADSVKPVSTAQQVALDAKAPLWDATATEVITGRKIGNLDVYARRVVGTSPAINTNGTVFTPSTGAASRLIGIEGWITRSGGTQRQLITALDTLDNAHVSPFYQDIATGAIYFYHSNATYASQTYEVVVYYTK